MNKVSGENIMDFTLREFREYFKKNSIPEYRAVQVFRSIHKNQKNNITGIKEIPFSLKKILSNRFYIPEITVTDIKNSINSYTKKFVFELKSYHREKAHKRTCIESVLIKDNKRNTICVSSQAGCGMGCEFCATAKMGFLRNLMPSEIIMQVYSIIQIEKIIPTNIVVMGMGEPFLNYDNLIKSLKILTDKQGLNISPKKITVSTIGLKSTIKKFADDLCLKENSGIKNIKLAFSLHSTDNGFREGIIPVSVKNKLSDIYPELIYFYRKTGTKITYEYIYFKGLNDTENDIKRIVKLSRMVPCNINIIRFNRIGYELTGRLSRFNKVYNTDNTNLNEFILKLKSYKIAVNLRKSSGEDIDAACGQLAVKF